MTFKVAPGLHLGIMATTDCQTSTMVGRVVLCSPNCYFIVWRSPCVQRFKKSTNMPLLIVGQSTFQTAQKLSFSACDHVISVTQLHAVCQTKRLDKVRLEEAAGDNAKLN